MLTFSCRMTLFMFTVVNSRLAIHASVRRRVTSVSQSTLHFSVGSFVSEDLCDSTGEEVSMMFRESVDHKTLTCVNYKFSPVPLRYDLLSEIGSFPTYRYPRTFH